MKSKTSFNVSMGLIAASLLMATQASAAVLSQVSFIAGKAVAVTVKDDAGKDVTSKFTISYSGSELKVGAFGGKPTIQGITAGQNYGVSLKENSSGNITNIPVSVTPASFYQLAVISGNGQSVVAGMQPSQSLVVQAQDMYKNGIANEKLSVTMPSGSSQLTTDSSGLAQISYTAGMNAGTEVISVVDGATTISFNEKILPNTNGVSVVKLSGVPSTADAGASFSITATLTDSVGAAVKGAYPVVMNAYLNNTCTKLDANVTSQTIQNSSGSVVFNGVKDLVQEQIYLGVFAGGHAACSPVISILPVLGSVSQLSFTQSPKSGKSGVSLFPPTQVQLQDSNGRIVTTSSDSIVVNAFSDATCSTSLPATGNSMAAASGKIQLNSLKVTQNGNAYIQAVDGLIKSTCIGPIAIAGTTSGGSTTQLTPIITQTYYSAVDNFKEHLIVSYDLGKNFKELVIPTPAARPDGDWSVPTFTYVTQNEIIAVFSLVGDFIPGSRGIYGLMYSDDKGATYKEIAMPETDIIGFAPPRISNGKIYIYGEFGPMDNSNTKLFVFESSDKGATFTKTEIPTQMVDPVYGAANFYDITVDSGNILVNYTTLDGNRNLFWMTKDKGVTFNEITYPHYDQFYVNVTATLNGDTLSFAGFWLDENYNNNEIFQVSNDLGKTYKNLDNIRSQFGFGPGLAAGKYILVKENEGYLSSDGGLTFQTIPWVFDPGTVYESPVGLNY